MFWKLIEFGYDREHGLWNSTTRFYDEDEARVKFSIARDEGCNMVMLEIRSDGYWEIVDSVVKFSIARDEGCNMVMLEIRSDGYWEIVDSVGFEEPGLRVTDKGFGVQIVEKDPDFPTYYQHWVMCNV
jgi:predicted N-formylglutamate amidohydrolase